MFSRRFVNPGRIRVYTKRLRQKVSPIETHAHSNIPEARIKFGRSFRFPRGIVRAAGPRDLLRRGGYSQTSRLENAGDHRPRRDPILQPSRPFALRIFPRLNVFWANRIFRLAGPVDGHRG